MTNFGELYCVLHGCAPREFVRRVFCASFSSHAILPGRLCATLLALPAFRAEKNLIAALGRAASLAQFKEELHYFSNRRQLGWLRRTTRLRISTRRLRALGTACFEEALKENHSRPAAA